MENGYMNFSEGGTLEMEINPDIEQCLIDNLELEIEALQGSREIMSNGKIRLVLEIDSPDKCKLVFAFMQYMIANAEQPIIKN